MMKLSKNLVLSSALFSLCVACDFRGPRDPDAPIDAYTNVGAESAEASDVACSDGVDNDDDGAIDCQDASCAPGPQLTVCDCSVNEYYSTREGRCVCSPGFGRHVRTGVCSPYDDGDIRSCCYCLDQYVYFDAPYMGTCLSEDRPRASARSACEGTLESGGWVRTHSTESSSCFFNCDVDCWFLTDDNLNATIAD